MSKYQKKNMLIGGLLAIVVLMAVAYAAFASNLTITGSGSVSSNWCIGFDSTRTSDYEATAGKQGGTIPTGSMSFDGQVCSNNYKTNASLNASFIQPGDKIEYTLTIGNKGTLAAAIESINVDNQSVTSDTTITKGNIKYIIEMPETTSLAVNDTTTMKVTAMFQNDTEVTSSTNEQQSISISINAVQDDGNGGFTPTPTSERTIKYAINSTFAVKIGDSIGPKNAIKWCLISQQHGSSCDHDYYFETKSECDLSIQNAISQGQIQEGEFTCEQGIARVAPDISVNTYDSCVATDKDACLKYILLDGVVEEIYACYIKDGNEYCLRGGIDESLSAETPIFNNNVLTIQNSLSECGQLQSGYPCDSHGFYLVVNKNGDVIAEHSGWRCHVDKSGTAACFVN